MYRMCLYYSVVIFSLLWKQCGPLYIRPETQNRMKEKIIHMEMELVKDVIMKIKAVNPFRDMYYKSVVFQAGQLLFFVKMRMNRLNYLYLITHHNVTNITDITRKVWNIKQSMDNLFEVEKICMELDTLVESMEEFEIKKEDKYAIHERMRYLRSGGNLDGDDAMMQMRAFHVNMENNMKNGTKKRKTGKWHYGGEDGIGGLMKNLQKSVQKLPVPLP